ncbi:hypothetical protein HII31_13642 [Pseudocercospora fuligena]|uniref:DUF6594 domain-containing protein n=1 Tax=Pseudocercospora fuligena TaxID=685502 RepID=A0A8H6R4H1_9PEZI|nr:hypothetical protein HII31_13642 [Pseudocercospora fuligena]
MHSIDQSIIGDEKAGFELASPSTGATSDQTFAKDVEAAKTSPGRSSWALRLIKRLGGSSTRKPQSKEDAVAEQQEEDQWASLTRSLDQTPQGYAAIAAFQSSDRNFLQYRGFGYLHSRILSDLQFGIERLEEELDELDQYDKDESRSRRLQCTEDDRDMLSDYPEYIERTRPTVLRELKEKLMEYDTVLLKTREMATLQRPARRDYESVSKCGKEFYEQYALDVAHHINLENFFVNFGPITDKESRFIRRKEDIVTLRSGRESAAFDGFVEICLRRAHKFMKHYFNSDIIHRWFLTQELRDKTDSKYINYFSPAKIDTLVNVIITIVIFILLVLPVIIMYRVTEMGKSRSPLDAIGVLIVFTLIFGMAVSALTTAKRHELFGASAAYAAVLVVFIGNFGVQQVDPGSTESWTSILTPTSS